MTPDPRTGSRLPVAANDEGVFSIGRDEGSSRPYAEWIGPHLALWAGYASAAEDRKRVASGGVVTTLLATALRRNLVDGVAVARLELGSGEEPYRFDIVVEPDRLAEYATSAYFNIPIEKHWRELDAFDGRLALCALPCHTSLLRNKREIGRGLENVELFLSLFCGHNNEFDLFRFVFRKAGLDEREVADVWVDRTYLGGALRVTLRDGGTTTIPFRHFNVYRSLGFFGKAMCRYCDDHLGAAADLSVGDVFVPEYRRREIQHSAIVARSPRGLNLVERALEDEVLKAEPIEPEVVFRAQRRILVPSADLESRYLANRFAGYPAKEPESGRFRLRSLLTYSLLLWNDRVSKSRWGPRLLRWIPRPLLYLYVAGIKLVNNSLKP